MAAGQSSSQPAKQMDLISSRSNLEKIHHKNGSLHQSFPVFFCEQQPPPRIQNSSWFYLQLSWLHLGPPPDSVWSFITQQGQFPASLFIPQPRSSEPASAGGGGRPVRHTQPCISCYSIFSHPTSPTSSLLQPFLIVHEPVVIGCCMGASLLRDTAQAATG